MPCRLLEASRVPPATRRPNLELKVVLSFPQAAALLGERVRSARFCVGEQSATMMSIWGWLPLDLVMCDAQWPRSRPA